MVPLTYRQEIVAPLFDLLRAGESCAVVGAGSMGKGHLLRFMLRADVQQHYLGEAAAATTLVHVDCNRLAELSEWGFFELLLTALTETAATGNAAIGDPATEAAATGKAAAADLRAWLNDLRREAIAGRDSLLARRHVELATRVLCRQQGRTLCFLLDECDAVYSALPPAVLANLRALRDADRYRLCYALLLRNHPAQLRPPGDHEGFYELLSRSVLGLKPHTPADAATVIAELAARRGRPVTPGEAAALLLLSGGHPGLLAALYDLLLHSPGSFAARHNVRWVLQQPQVYEECRKLWEGLGSEEQEALNRLAQGAPCPAAVRALLLLKGLVSTPVDAAVGASVGAPVGVPVVIFSPLFHEYALAQEATAESHLVLNAESDAVWVEGRRVEKLSRLEFKLLSFLYGRLGQLCTREQIIAALHPSETFDAAASDSRIDSLVRHLRRAIEPLPDRPRYLLTVRGRGYKLVDRPESSAAQGPDY